MILMYHKVAAENKTMWWVSADAFYRQMVQLAHKKVVYLDEYDPKNPDHVVITFDGIYTNVLRYAAPILEKFGYPFELFITSDYIGKTNQFDDVEPPADFASEAQLRELMSKGGRLQWHTKTHADITTLSDRQVAEELVIPAKLKKLDKKGFKWFAYAYGKSDERSRELVRKNFKGGLACDDGNYNDKTIWPRKTVTEETQLDDKKVSVLVPSYNYGHFLVEAIDSVLRQTYLPDEIILSDDASSDHTYEIMKSYKRKYPDLIRINKNEKNEGIESHFNKIVSMAKGDFICLLGADNRFPSNYVEECYKTLSANEKCGIAYTDFALFGNRAEHIYNYFDEEYQGGYVAYDTYLIHFPEFNKSTKKHMLEKGNFMHGSSMYRKDSFDKVGGYPSRASGPEDHSFFKAIIKAGRTAQKVPNIYLEYRQHSAEQANHRFNYFNELAFLRTQFVELTHHTENLQTELERVQNNEQQLHAHINSLSEQIKTITSSKAWKMIESYRRVKDKIKR